MGKYSNYSSEQIIDEMYEKICNLLLKLANDDDTKEKMKRDSV